MRRIPLHRRDGTIRAYALVDDADFGWLNEWRWYCNDGYVARKPNKHSGPIWMHRVILGLSSDDRRQGEHINRDPLDNRRHNLRVAVLAHADNNQNVGLRADNKSGYRGVSWQQSKRKWRAYGQQDGRQRHLGYFDTPESADAVVKAFRAEHMPFSEDALAA